MERFSMTKEIEKLTKKDQLNQIAQLKRQNLWLAKEVAFWRNQATNDTITAKQVLMMAKKNA